MTDQVIPLTEWQAHTSSVRPAALTRGGYVDVQRLNGEIDFDMPACAWNWSQDSKLFSPIAAWRLAQS